MLVSFQKRKFEDMKLSNDVLDKLENNTRSDDSNKKSVKKSKKLTAKPTKKIFEDDDMDLSKNSISDLKPTKTYKYLILFIKSKTEKKCNQCF
jgi:hypothetical protein